MSTYGLPQGMSTSLGFFSIATSLAMVGTQLENIYCRGGGGGGGGVGGGGGASGQEDE